MGSGLVVELHVLGEDSLQVGSREHEEVIQALLSDGTHPTFAYAFALGEPTRVRILSAPIEANTSSKLAMNLVSHHE